jgi:hypothetical protein
MVTVILTAKIVDYYCTSLDNKKPARPDDLRVSCTSLNRSIGAGATESINIIIYFQYVVTYYNFSYQQNYQQLFWV